MSISLQVDGRRIYISGDTYPHRESIRAIGAHWDPERKAWWVSSAKRDAAEKLAARIASAPAPTPAPAPKPAAKAALRTTRSPRSQWREAREGETLIQRRSRGRDDGYCVGQVVVYDRGAHVGVVVHEWRYRDEDSDEWQIAAYVVAASAEQTAEALGRREAAQQRTAAIEALRYTRDVGSVVESMPAAAEHIPAPALVSGTYGCTTVDVYRSGDSYYLCIPRMDDAPSIIALDERGVAHLRTLGVAA